MFLEEVKEHSVDAIAYQEYPYGDLVKKLHIPDGRNTLFDVMFGYQSEEMTKTIFGDQAAELIPIPVKASKYDFTLIQSLPLEPGLYTEELSLITNPSNPSLTTSS